jgi:hypothetical protein
MQSSGFGVAAEDLPTQGIPSRFHRAGAGQRYVESRSDWDELGNGSAK